MGLYGRGISFNNIFIRRNQCAPMRPPLARPPMFGGIFSGVSISESFTYKTNFWDAITSLATAFTMAAPFLMSSRSQGATPQGATTNQPKEDKSLSNLVSFYGSKYTINSHPTKPGYYEAVLKGGEGKVIEGDYETLKFLLGKEPDKGKVEEPTKKTTDPEEPTVKKDEPENLEPESPAAKKPVARKEQATPADKSRKAQGTQKEEWTAEKKAKPYRLQMTVVTSRTGTSVATVVTPDGKTYKAYKNISGSGRSELNTLAGLMQERLKEAGWTNVTLENKNFNWASDGNAPTGKVDKPAGAEKWTPEKKAAYNKPHKISFAVRSGGYVGNSGSATVTTPDGKLYQVQTGMSLTASRARKDLVAKMIAALKAAGWTQATVTNENWPDDCK